MTPEQFEALFDTFEHSAFRLETLPSYNVGGRDLERFEAYRDGRELPPRDGNWLHRIAATTRVGMTWTRVRIVDTPLTEYELFELDVSYHEAERAGDQTLVVWRSSHPIRFAPLDFWLFDAGTDNARAVLMDYTDDGRWRGARLVEHRANVIDFEQTAVALTRQAVPFRLALPLRHA